MTWYDVIWYGWHPSTHYTYCTLSMYVMSCHHSPNLSKLLLVASYSGLKAPLHSTLWYEAHITSLSSFTLLDVRGGRYTTHAFTETRQDETNYYPPVSQAKALLSNPWLSTCVNNLHNIRELRTSSSARRNFRKYLSVKQARKPIGNRKLTQIGNIAPQQQQQYPKLCSRATFRPVSYRVYKQSINTKVDITAYFAVPISYQPDCQSAYLTHIVYICAVTTESCAVLDGVMFVYP